MNPLILFALFLVLAGAAAWKIFQASRRAAKAEEEKRMERLRKEREILDRVETIKKKTDLDFARKLVEKDSERAARTVARMMKKG